MEEQIEFRVLVLMSTFNGEDFISDQLLSILYQRNVAVKLLIRDDGSTDNTVHIIKKIQLESVEYEIELLEGNNKGCTLSYLELVNYAKNNYKQYDYFAFSDQDDVWLPNKLFEAVYLLNLKSSKNKLYYSSFFEASKDLQDIRKVSISRKDELLETLVSLNTLGCCMVFSYNLLESVSKLKSEFNNLPINHDGLTYFCALLTRATILNDPNSYILYRQHGRNVVGSRANSLIPRIKRILMFPSYKIHLANKVCFALNSSLTNPDSQLLHYASTYKFSLRVKMKLIRIVCKSNLGLTKKIQVVVLILINLF